MTDNRPSAAARSLLGGCALLAALAAGCSSNSVIEIHDTAEFQLSAMQNPRPVLVMFYKAGCLACTKFNPVMNQLASEYEGRVTFANFMILDLLFHWTAPELQARYEIQSVPHVVLLYRGQERGHWLLEYNIEVYRKAINDVLATPATGPAGGPAASPRVGGG